MKELEAREEVRREQRRGGGADEDDLDESDYDSDFNFEDYVQVSY